METSISTLANATTMSSLQIAEATGKQHSHIMRDIRKMVEKINDSNEATSGLVGSGYHRGDRTQYKYLSEETRKYILDFAMGKSNSQYQITESCYMDAKGEKRIMFNLNKKACILLASGYDVILRAKIIDRWEELETQAAQTTLNLPAQTLDTVERLHKALCDARETIDRQNNILDEKSRIISDMERMASLLDPDHKSFTSSVDFQFVVDCMTRLLRLELVKAERVEAMEERISKLERSMKEKGGEI